MDLTDLTDELGLSEGGGTRSGQREPPLNPARDRELGHNLRRARAAEGLSQERVASAAGLAKYTYQRLEEGESKPGTPLNPRLNTLLALSQVLGVSLAELVPKVVPDLIAGR